jgi:hypothetical protein
MALVPDAVLAGGPSGLVGQPDSAPTAPNLAVPDTTNTGGASLLSGLPPAPKPGGISESPQDQFRRLVAQNANTAIKGASDPSAPFAWAKALVGSVIPSLAGTALGGLGAAADIGRVPPGAGALYGINKTVAGLNAQKAEQQKQAAQQKQQAFENDYKTQELQLRKDAQQAQQAANLVQSQKALHELDKEAQDTLFTATAPWRDAAEKAGQQKIQDGLTSNDINEIKMQHATKDDPNGTKWAMDQNIKQTGWQPITNENGDPTGQRRATYSIYTWGDPVQVNDQMSADAKKYLDKDLPKGTILDPKDSRTVELQIQKARTDEMVGLGALAAAGKLQNEIDTYKKNSDFKAASETLVPWLVDAHGDYGLAMTRMQDAANEKDAAGQLTTHAQEVQKQFLQVQRGLSPEIVKTDMDLSEKKAIEEVKANAKSAAEGKKTEAQGDTNLTGLAYLNSIQDPSERNLVNQIGNGQLPVNRIEYLLARNPRILQEVSLAFPDIDAGKFPGYIAAIKEFNTGKAATQIKAINTALPHLDQLYTAVENGFGTTIPGISNVERALGNQNAIDVNNLRTIASQELAKIYATGAVTDQERKEFNNQIQGFQTPAELKGTVYAMVNALTKQVDSLENQWETSLPSKRFRPARAIIDQDAQKAMADIVSRHSGAGPMAQTPAQQQQDSVQRLNSAAGQPAAHKIGDIILQAGVPFKVTSVDANGKVTGADFNGPR